MNTLFEKYKSCCPNSIVQCGEISEQEMQRAIDRFEANERQKESSRVDPPSEEDQKRYDEWREARRVKRFSELSRIKQETIRNAIWRYEEKHGFIEEVYLSGSHTSGAWIDRDSTQEDREIRGAVRTVKEQSDIDLISVPFMGSMQIGMVDFTSAPKGTKVLIYKNGSYVSGI